MCGGLVIPTGVKERRRNSEKRKEKSRDAARCRRSKESEIFQELASCLPLPKNVQLDKTSIMRLTVGFLKFRHMLEVFIPQHKTPLAVTNVDSGAAEVLHGFLLILTDDGNIIFLSENVQKYLGITQDEMMGQSIYEFTHPCDHDEVKAMLVSKRNGEINVPEPTSFFIRMKSTVKSKGRNINLKSESYRVIHCIGNKVGRILKKHCGKCPTFYLISIAEPVPHPACIDVPLDKQLFFSRHSPDMKFTDVDDNIHEFLGYRSEELVGKSVYSFFHASDSETLADCYKTLFHKGQCETGYYRFLAKYGGHVWLLTRATIIYDNSTKPECVVCLNYILSKIENEGQIVSSEQVARTIEAETENQTKEEGEKEDTTLFVFVSSTKFVFSPKQQEEVVEEVMNKNYLSFPDADLLLFQESMKDSKLPLDLEFLDDEPCPSVEGISDDPFINYRDDSLSPGCCGTPDSSLPQSSSSGSPDHFSTMPSTPDSGSLSDIPNLDPIDEFANLDLKLTMSPSELDKECDYEDVNFECRAPYIPMSMDDDFPLISPSNSVMWGPQEPVSKKAAGDSVTEVTDQQTPPLKTKTSNESVAKSSLAALLQSDLNKKQPVSKHERTKLATQRDPASHKKWPNTHSAEGNNRGSVAKVVGNVGLHKSLTPFRNGTSNGSSGHIIMLDTLPCKKQLPPSKSSNYHRKNGQNISTTMVNNHSSAPSLGSHTATVKVNDRLIKVQVSVSELPNVSLEQKMSLPSPPDPSHKRLGPSLPGPSESPKRFKVDNSGVLCTGAPATDSVLLNLLISGEDASRGYLSSGNSRYPESQCIPPVLSLPVPNDASQCDSLPESVLLASESELLDSFLNISQYDTDMNAPIQTSHLLQGEDLLDALELPPSLRDVPALV